MKLEAVDREGVPTGLYDVTYYWVHLESDRVTRRVECDRDVPASYLSRLHPKRREVIRAACKSQPGGLTLYGSEEARRIFALSDFAA